MDLILFPLSYTHKKTVFFFPTFMTYEHLKAILNYKHIQHITKFHNNITTFSTLVDVININSIDINCRDYFLA
jgi:hypothetical protein